jgi:hypothetical protein
VSIAVECVAKRTIRKMYVVGSRTRKEDEPPIDPRKPLENIDVWFSPARGDWLMDYKQHAQRELDLLTSSRVHVDEHYCQLELEEEDGTFAIVCREHPKPAAKPVGSVDSDPT